MAAGSFTCPRPECGHITRGTGLARWCEACREFTGRCAADAVAVALYETGLVSMPGWPWPCTSPGPERWLLTGAGDVKREIVLCETHGDRLRGGAAVIAEARGVRLEYLGSSSENSRVLSSKTAPGRRPATNSQVMAAGRARTNAARRNA